MNIMLSNHTNQLISMVSDRLTKTERRIAEAVLEEPTLLAFGTVSDLATQVGTSRPSIVRFATKLGFKGFTELQAFVRQGLSAELSRPADRIRSENNGSQEVREKLVAAVESVYEVEEQGRFREFSELIVAANRVWIVTGETSRAGGYALHSGLSMIREDVHFLREHSVASDLTDTGPDDVAIVFDFQRYRRASIMTAKTLDSLGVTVLAITDGPLSPLTSVTRHWCQLPVMAVGPFDSSVPAVTAAELLVAQVTRDLKASARKRIDRIESLWDATNTFYP